MTKQNIALFLKKPRKANPTSSFPSNAPEYGVDFDEDSFFQSYEPVKPNRPTTKKGCAACTKRGFLLYCVISLLMVPIIGYVSVTLIYPRVAEIVIDSFPIPTTYAPPPGFFVNLNNPSGNTFRFAISGQLPVTLPISAGFQTSQVNITTNGLSFIGVPNGVPPVMLSNPRPTIDLLISVPQPDLMITLGKGLVRDAIGAINAAINGTSVTNSTTTQAITNPIPGMVVYTSATVNIFGFNLPAVPVHKSLPYFPQVIGTFATPNLTVNSLKLGNATDFAKVPFFIGSVLQIPINVTMDAMMVSSIVVDIFFGNTTEPLVTTTITPKINQGNIDAQLSGTLMGAQLSALSNATEIAVGMSIRQFDSQASWLQQIISGTSLTIPLNAKTLQRAANAMNNPMINFDIKPILQGGDISKIVENVIDAFPTKMLAAMQSVPFDPVTITNASPNRFKFTATVALLPQVGNVPLDIKTAPVNIKLNNGILLSLPDALKIDPATGKTVIDQMIETPNPNNLTNFGKGLIASVVNGLGGTTSIPNTGMPMIPSLTLYTMANVLFANMPLSPIPVHKNINLNDLMGTMGSLQFHLSNITLGNIQSLASIPFTATANIILPLKFTTDIISNIQADALIGSATAPVASLNIQPNIYNGNITAQVQGTIMIGNAVNTFTDALAILSKGTTATINVKQFQSQATWLQNVVQNTMMTSPTVTLGQLASAALNMGTSPAVTQAMQAAGLTMKQMLEGALEGKNIPASIVTAMEKALNLV